MRKTNESLFAFAMVTRFLGLQLYVIGVLCVGMDEFVVAGIGPGYEIAAARQALLMAVAPGAGIAATDGAYMGIAFFFEDDIVPERAARLPGSVLQFFVNEVDGVVPLSGYEYAAIVAVYLTGLYFTVGHGPQVRDVSIFRLKKSDEADDE